MKRRRILRSPRSARRGRSRSRPAAVAAQQQQQRAGARRPGAVAFNAGITSVVNPSTHKGGTLTLA